MEQILLRAPKKEPSLLTPCFWSSGFQNSEKMKVSYIKPPGLWYFLPAALDTWYTHCGLQGLWLLLHPCVLPSSPQSGLLTALHTCWTHLNLRALALTVFFCLKHTFLTVPVLFSYVTQFSAQMSPLQRDLFQYLIWNGISFVTLYPLTLLIFFLMCITSRHHNVYMHISPPASPTRL